MLRKLPLVVSAPLLRLSLCATSLLVVLLSEGIQVLTLLSYLQVPNRSITFNRACYGVLRFIMESGAKGCEVVVSGKLRGQRAKSMKFVDGLMIHSGEPTNVYVDCAVRHVLLRQGKFLAFVYT